ncbi:MAG TPA: ABC transporter ATP-binding protein [bacterium]|nr:ABC transporter ATP-binding protein [bacterium]
MLEVRDLTKRFRGMVALNQVSFAVGGRQLVGVIGPNGAGKTTLFNIVAGRMRPTTGRVLFEGRPISGLPLHRAVAAGVAATFQIPRPLRRLSVIENVAVVPPGLRARGGGSSPLDTLRRFELDHVARALAGALTQGQLRLLEVARAVATGPRLLLLDEPYAGLTAEEMQRLTAVIRDLHAGGLTIIVVEHKLRELMRLVEHIIVLNYGRVLAAGAPAEVARNPEVVEAYMGTHGAPV